MTLLYLANVRYIFLWNRFAPSAAGENNVPVRIFLQRGPPKTRDETAP